MSDDNFFDFITEVLTSCRFDWHVKLGFVPARLKQTSNQWTLWEDIWAETDPNQLHWTKTPGSAEECIEQWLDEIQVGPGPSGPGVRDYLWLEERKACGDVRFHVLIGHWNGDENQWIQRWKEISGGWAFTQVLDERIAGRLGHFVMRAGCSLELNCGGFYGNRTSLDFRPWREKSR